jgi:hypothetical protein
VCEEDQSIHSVSWHQTTQESLAGFSFYLILENFAKNVYAVAILIEIGKL